MVRLAYFVAAICAVLGGFGALVSMQFDSSEQQLTELQQSIGER